MTWKNHPPGIWDCPGGLWVEAYLIFQRDSQGAGRSTPRLCRVRPAWVLHILQPLPSLFLLGLTQNLSGPSSDGVLKKEVLPPRGNCIINPIFPTWFSSDPGGHPAGWRRGPGRIPAETGFRLGFQGLPALLH